MRPAIKALDRRFYPTFGDNWDDALFRDRILKYLRPAHTILDLGAGSGLVSQMDFRGKCKAVYGVDPEESVMGNPHLDFACVGTAERIPAQDASFDLIFADNVLEHLAEPQRVFDEIYRTLKPGGVFLGKTPSRFHYVPLLAQVTPLWFHRLANNLRGRNREDTFPTRYKANSKRRVTELARKAVLEVESLEQIEGRPEYMRISPLLYPFGLLYERLVNATNVLATFRVLLIVVLRKPEIPV